MFDFFSAVDVWQLKAELPSFRVINEWLAGNLLMPFVALHMLFDDEYFMRAALAEAGTAFEKDEVPVGAVIVAANRIIARGHNMVEQLRDVTAHAEILAFGAAANALGSKFLNDCTLYVTVEPCLMCAGAAYWSRIGTVVFGTPDVKRGYSVFEKEMKIFHPSTVIRSGVLEKECAALMTDYFRAKR